MLNNNAIDWTILGTIYEQSLEKYVRKQGGIFYTPKFITQFICDNTIGEICRNKKNELNFNDLSLNKIEIYKNWLFNLKILDPACGSGAFLIAALDYLIAEHHNIDNLMYLLTGEAFKLFDTDKAILEKNIYGVDINDESVDIAKLSLWLHTAKRERKLSDLSGNIKCGNSLIDNHEFAGEKAFNWQNEFPEIMQSGGFDVVIGNPPYGAEMTKKQTDFLDSINSEHKSSTKNSAIYFIYQANHLIKPEGCFAFIVPKSLCYSNGWSKCAEFLIPKLTKLIDTGKAFKEVLLEQVIFIYNRQSNVINYKTGICEDYKIKELEIIDKNIFNNFKVLIAGNSFSEIKIIEKISKNKHKYGDFVSIERGLNWQSKVKNNAGETPIYRGAQLDRYFLNEASDFIDISKFNKNEYSYQLKPKILNQLAIAHVIYPHPHFYLQSFIDEDNRLVFETISCTFSKYNEIDLYFLLALNNSKLFAWILYKFIYSNAIRSTRFDEKYVGRIPVPNLLEINSKDISEKVKLLLSNIQLIRLKQNEFLQIVKANFKNVKLNNKLNSFNNFDFSVFLEELKKQKIEIELKKQSEWLNFFNEYKNGINSLQSKANQIDREIDHLIYNFYNLSPEEIQTIENEHNN